MANCLNSSERTRIRALIVEKEDQLAVANATYLKALQSDAEQYKLDTGEGSQMTKKRKLSEIKEAIDSLQQEIENLYRRLRCGGLVKMNLRRKI